MAASCYAAPDAAADTVETSTFIQALRPQPSDAVDEMVFWMVAKAATAQRRNFLRRGLSNDGHKF